MTVISYIVRRLLWIIPVLFAVSIITFFLMHAVPGGPWDREKRLPAGTSGAAQRQVRAGQAALRAVHQLGRRVHPGRPRAVLPVRGPDASTTSSPTASGPPSSSASWPSSWPSSSASRSGSSPRSATTAGPDYVSTERLDHRHRHAQLRAGDPADRRLQRPVRLVPDRRLEGPAYWVLPTIALAGFPIAVIARYTRASMLEVTRKDYIRTAHSKGLRDQRGGRRAT